MSVAPCFRSLPSSGTSRAAAGARRVQRRMAAAALGSGRAWRFFGRAELAMRRAVAAEIRWRGGG